MHGALHSYSMFHIFPPDFTLFSALEKSSPTQGENVQCGWSLGPDVTGGANPLELKLWHEEDPKLGLLKSSRWPEMPRAFADCLPEVSPAASGLTSSFGGRLAAGRQRAAPANQPN